MKVPIIISIFHVIVVGTHPSGGLTAKFLGVDEDESQGGGKSAISSAYRANDNQSQSAA